MIRILLPIGIKAALDGTLAREVERERDRRRALEELGKRFSELRTAPPTWPPSA